MTTDERRVWSNAAGVNLADWRTSRPVLRAMELRSGKVRKERC